MTDSRTRGRVVFISDAALKLALRNWKHYSSTHDRPSLERARRYLDLAKLRADFYSHSKPKEKQP